MFLAGFFDLRSTSARWYIISREEDDGGRNRTHSRRDGRPGPTTDPVRRARNLDEAEELYLDESLPVIMELIGSPLTNEELERHPLMVLLRRRGMRGREDSLL